MTPGIVILEADAPDFPERLAAARERGDDVVLVDRVDTADPNEDPGLAAWDVPRVLGAPAIRGTPEDRA